MATKLSSALASTLANAITTAADAGAGPAKIILYNNDGAEPATADTAITTQDVLATFTLSDPSFGSASSGTITIDNTPALTVAASATGTASFFRLVTSADVVILQGTVGLGSAQLNLNTLSITSGVNVTITSGTITVPTA